MLSSKSEADAIPPDSELITVDEVAAMLRLSKRTVWRYEKIAALRTT
jgi:hypothetical protein